MQKTFSHRMLSGSITHECMCIAALGHPGASCRVLSKSRKPMLVLSQLLQDIREVAVGSKSVLHIRFSSLLHIRFATRAAGNIFRLQSRSCRVLSKCRKPSLIECYLTQSHTSVRAGQGIRGHFVHRATTSQV